MDTFRDHPLLAKKEKKEERFALCFEDYVSGDLQYLRRGSNSGGDMGFIVLPFMLFNSRKRVQTQISRISQYSRKLISSRRIDDNDSIRKNISNLIQEIKDNISKSNKAKKISIKYGEKVLLVHATTGLFMSVEPRVRERLTLGQWR